MRRFALMLAILAAPAGAADTAWKPMTGPQITETLTGRTLKYENGWQDFRASGRTLHHVGRDSWGYWAVRGDQYCSMWPPSDLWACYDMARLGDRVRFIGAGAGDVIDAVLVE